MNDDKRPVIAFYDPHAAAYPQDAVRDAAADLAQRAANRYVALLAGHAAFMIREAFGDRAHRVLFEQDTSPDGLTSIALLSIYDSADRLIWYDVDSGLHRTSEVLDRDHDEATGGPPTERLDQHSKEHIEEIIGLAQRHNWDGCWFTNTDLTLTGWNDNGVPTHGPYHGWLLDFVVTDEIAFAADVRTELDQHRSTETSAGPGETSPS